MEKSNIAIIVLSLTILVLVGFIVLSSNEKEVETEQELKRYVAYTEQGCVELALSKSKKYQNCINVGRRDLYGYESLHINCVTDAQKYLNICDGQRQLAERNLGIICSEFFPSAIDILAECLSNLE